MNKCLYCGKETNNPKYCSRNCSATANNKMFPKRKLKRKCVHCDNIVKNYKHTLCEAHYEEYKNKKYLDIKNLTLADYWNRKSLEKLHSSSKSSHIRTLGRIKHKELLKRPCFNCGYDKHVELCHIKPIRSFLPTDKIEDVNSINNVIQLCRNCHWEFDKGLLVL